MENKKGFMPAKELQSLMGISRVTEISWRRKGFIPKTMILGKRVFYLREEIQRFLADKGIKNYES